MNNNSASIKPMLSVVPHKEEDGVNEEEVLSMVNRRVDLKTAPFLCANASMSCSSFSASTAVSNPGASACATSYSVAGSDIVGGGSVRSISAGDAEAFLAIRICDERGESSINLPIQIPHHMVCCSGQQQTDLPIQCEQDRAPTAAVGGSAPTTSGSLPEIRVDSIGARCPTVSPPPSAKNGVVRPSPVKPVPPSVKMPTLSGKIKITAARAKSSRESKSPKRLALSKTGDNSSDTCEAHGQKGEVSHLPPSVESTTREEGFPLLVSQSTAVDASKSDIIVNNNTLSTPLSFFPQSSLGISMGAVVSSAPQNLLHVLNSSPSSSLKVEGEAGSCAIPTKISCGEDVAHSTEESHNNDTNLSNSPKPVNASGGAPSSSTDQSTPSSPPIRKASEQQSLLNSKAFLSPSATNVSGPPQELLVSVTRVDDKKGSDPNYDANGERRGALQIGISDTPNRNNSNNTKNKADSANADALNTIDKMISNGHDAEGGGSSSRNEHPSVRVARRMASQLVLGHRPDDEGDTRLASSLVASSPSASCSDQSTLSGHRTPSHPHHLPSLTLSSSPSRPVDREGAVSGSTDSGGKNNSLLSIAVPAGVSCQLTTSGAPGASHDTSSSPLLLDPAKASFAQRTASFSSCSSTASSIANSTQKSILLREDEIRVVLLAVREVFMSQPMLVEVEAPTNVCGDIHGQYYDLLRIFKRCGWPRDGQQPGETSSSPRGGASLKSAKGSSKNPQYLFLGDYVDRGKHSIETIMLLFCYKILYPTSVWLLRGNHECAAVTKLYGFYDDVKRKYNIRLWKAFTDVFNTMPCCAVISEKIICMHGGLSPDLTSVKKVHAIQRPCEVPDVGILCDLLWSDPAENVEGFVPSGQYGRGVSYVFGRDIVETFLDMVDMDLIVRGHEVMERGYGFFADRQLVTIFSAPNYCGEFDNDGAVMVVGADLICSFVTIHGSRIR